MAPSDHDLPPPTPLRESELADAEALVREAGWNQTADDWRIFLALGTVHANRDQGRVIATAATLPWGGQFGWISMVLVAGSYRRRGLATQLLHRCIDDLVGQRLLPVLDATPAGREVYRGLGFKDTWTFQRWMRDGRPSASTIPVADLPAGTTLLATSDALWPALCAYDGKIFGADRSAFLAHLRGRAARIERIAVRNDAVVGAVLGREGRAAMQIGPLIADDDDTARVLLAQALDQIDGPVFIDVPDTKTAVIADLTARGFRPQRPLTRMLLGRDTAFDDGQRTYAVAGPEFG